VIVAAIVALGLIFADTPGSAPPVKGTYTIGGPFVFQDAVAHRKTDWDGPKVVVVLFAQPVDHAALARTLDVDGAVEAAKEAGSWAELEFAEDGTWKMARYSMRSAGGSSGGSKYDPHFAATMKATIQGGRVTGRVHGAFDPDYAIDLTLALPITDPPAGNALPADGGEPGRALRACAAAFAKKNLPDVERLCASNLGGIITSAIRMKADGVDMPDPWTPAGAGQCEVAAVSGLTLGNGVVAGDEAKIKVSGGSDEGRRCEGDVILRRENGAWRVAASRLELMAQ
jgi:hypothetical protein